MIVGALLLGLLATPVSALTATAPVWQKGDSWAMGKEIDLGSNVTENLDALNLWLDQMVNVTIDDLKVDSKASMYAMFTVVDENATTYTVEAEFAAKFATQADISVTGKMPLAGTYGVYEQPFSSTSTVTKEVKTITIDLTEKMGAFYSTTLIVEKNTYAIQSMECNAMAAMSLDVVAVNLPDINTTDTQQIISYKNYDVGMNLVAQVNLTILFDPSLVIFEFPFTVGDTWTTNECVANISGDVSGTFDAHGLSVDQKAQIFTEEVKNATGATDFPIVFDHLTSPNGEITNGKFGPVNETLSATLMECTDAEAKTYGSVEFDVFEVTVGYSENKIYYTPGMKLFAMALDTADLPTGSDAVMSLMGGQGAMQMEPVSTATASAQISAIESYTNNVAGQSGGSTSNAVGDFFLKAPFLGVILIVVVIVAIGAVFVLSKKGRPK
jgi:hypothetical protein